MYMRNVIVIKVVATEAVINLFDVKKNIVGCVITFLHLLWIQDISNKSYMS